MKMSMSVVPAVQRMNRPIGAILVDAGKLSAQDVEQILQAQRQHDLRFGDTAIKLGLLTPQDVQHALAEQFAFPYLRSAPEGRAMSEDLQAAYEPFGPGAERNPVSAKPPDAALVQQDRKAPGSLRRRG